MPYVERVTKAGNTIEIERYFTSRYKKKGISRGDKVKPTKEEQEKVNTRQAERKLRILINANYGYGDYHLVLDYIRRKGEPDRTPEQMRQDIDVFLRECRKEYRKAGLEFKYIHVMEIGKVLKTKEDYYNCLAMVASGELAAADLLAKIESAENQRYIECGVAAVEEEKKAVTVYYCDEAAVGMKFVAGDVSGTVQGVTHIQTDEAAAAGEAGNDRTALTLSKAVKAGCKVIALERTDTVAGMTTDDIAALKGVLKQYE